MHYGEPVDGALVGGVRADSSQTGAFQHVHQHKGVAEAWWKQRASICNQLIGQEQRELCNRQVLDTGSRRRS